MKFGVLITRLRKMNLYVTPEDYMYPAKIQCSAINAVYY